MLAVTLTAEINCPAPRVYDYLADLTSMGEWMTLVERCELVAGEAGKAGALYDQDLLVGNTAMKGTIEITDVTAGSRLVTMAKTGILKLQTVFEVAPEGQGSKLTMIVDAGAAGAAMRPLIKANGQENIEAIKAVLEA